MPTVEVRNGSFEGAMRKFKKAVERAGIMQELRNRQEYEKPTTKRKRAKAAAIKRRQREDTNFDPLKSKRDY